MILHICDAVRLKLDVRWVDGDASDMIHWMEVRVFMFFLGLRLLTVSLLGLALSVVWRAGQACVRCAAFPENEPVLIPVSCVWVGDERHTV